MYRDEKEPERALIRRDHLQVKFGIGREETEKDGRGK